MPLSRQENLPYSVIYTNEKGFRAEQVFNLRDGMNCTSVIALPENPEDIKAAITELKDILFEKEYGAKAMLYIPPTLLPKIPEGLLTPGKCPGRYTSKAAGEAAAVDVRKKEKVQTQLAKFDLGEYRLLNKEDLIKENRAQDLAEFKILYSSFVNEGKIKSGFYSDVAEQAKLLNPNIEEYAIEHEGKIIATTMLLKQHDLAYEADFVIHPDHRNQGLAQAWIIKSHETYAEKHPDVQGFWFIAGGYGGTDIGAKLYDQAFPTIDLNPEKLEPGKKHPQETTGLFLKYGAPKPVFLKISNRSEKGEILNEDGNIKKALADLEKSKEPNFGAVQPQIAAIKPKVEVRAMSMFPTQQKNVTQVAGLHEAQRETKRMG